MDTHLLYHIAFDVAIILAVTFAVSFSLRILFNQIRQKSKHKWLKILSDALYDPSRWLVWGYGFLYLIHNLSSRHAKPLEGVNFQQIRYIFFATAIFYILFVWKQKIEHFLHKRAGRRASKKDDQALITALGRLSTIALIILAGLIFLEILNVPITGLLAFGGVGGIAVSLSAGDVIKNFFGGLMIYMNRHFREGDWIRSPNKNFEGVVETIGWYMTRVRTFDRRPMFIPNGVITDAIIENPGRMYNRRIKKTIGIRYRDIEVVKPIVDGIRNMLQEHPAIDLNQFLMVDLLDFGPYSVDISVYTFTKTTNWAEWREQQQDVLIKISEIVTEHGAQIAFPTTTVHLQSNES